MWLNKFKVNRPLKVLFIDQERSKVESKRRFKALLQAKQLDKQHVPYLYTKFGTSYRLNLPQSFEAFRKYLQTISPDLIIWDSFATAHTSEENNRQSIQAVLEKIKELRNEFGCTFLFIHHENKTAFNTGEEAQDPSIAHMAGNVAIPAAADLVLTVRKSEGGTSIIYNTKNTLAPAIEPFTISVEDVENGIKVEAA